VRFISFHAGLVNSDPRVLRWEKWLCGFAVAGVLVVSATLFWFAHPLADDFARSYKGRAQGAVPATIHEYFTWTGRWAACGLNYFLTSSFDLVRFYRLLLLINPTLLAGSVYALLSAAEIGATRRQRLALTAAAMALLGVTLTLTVKEGASNVIPWVLDIRRLAGKPKISQ
jgi:hypothetical protein